MWHLSEGKKSNLMALDWNDIAYTSQIDMDGSSTQIGNDEMGPLFDQIRDVNGFSSSLPTLRHEKLNFGSRAGQPEDNGHDVDDGDELLGQLDEELVSHAIGDLLPNEEELLAGINRMNINDTVEEIEEFDVFSSGGGLELDGEEGFGLSINSSSRGVDGFYIGGAHLYGGVSSNGQASVIGEHPFGEHPSRTLFVRNINSNVEDSELRALFEHYGDIRTLYTDCKHRGFVMISYYDIRAARTTMRNLQNKLLRGRKLDIHFSIPKDNPSDKAVNQGTLVVFNLDPSVSNDNLRQIFGHYGEVKEIRETPHKRHHKFIEFYDVRAAEAALRALNRSDIAGKRIKLEPSRPGGARRSLMQQLSQDPDQDDSRLLRQQSSPPVVNSPPGHLPPWGNFGSPLESGPPRLLHQFFGPSVLNTTKCLPGLPVPTSSNHTRVGTIGSHLGRNNQVDGGLPFLPSAGQAGVYGLPSHHAQSLPEYANVGMPFYSPTTPMLIRGASHGGLDSEALGMQSMGSMHRLNSASAGSSSLSGPQFLWGNSIPYQQANLPPTWSNPPPVGHCLNSIMAHQSFGHTGNHSRAGKSSLPLHRQHVGSAPSGDPSILERQFAYLRESPETSFFHPGLAIAMNVPGGTGSGMGMMSLRRRGHMFPASGVMIGGGGYFDLLGADRGRVRRTESNVLQLDNKKQYQLDIDRIARGEDTRTTLMIKNIPNKYTSKMLLAAIDEHHKGMYDFLYLPIDFKNKCNVGYAFINMTSASYIIPIYQAFNGKKWEKFNSEKVASLAYARIQGLAALVAHFQNSSLMNEDKRCRPILFNSEGPETGYQEPSVLEVATQPVTNVDLMDATTESVKRSSTVGNQEDLVEVPSSEGLDSSSPEKE